MFHFMPVIVETIHIRPYQTRSGRSSQASSDVTSEELALMHAEMHSRRTERSPSPPISEDGDTWEGSSSYHETAKDKDPDFENGERHATFAELHPINNPPRYKLDKYGQPERVLKNPWARRSSVDKRGKGERS